jgi:hypothetical protein
MKTIIALQGVANQGKSTSIKMAYALLKAAYPSAKIDERFIGADITVVITINGVKVGIESQGDPNSRLFESLGHFVKVGCKAIICATRSRGKTVEAVNALAGKYKIDWHPKSSASSVQKEEAANRAVARQIVSAVQAAIDA